MSLNKIAQAGFDIQIFEAEDLVAALDGSGDLRTAGMDGFDDLMIEKYMDIDPLLYTDLNLLGIENPIMIEAEDGELIMMDGHHRLAWAIVEKQPVPVVFIHWDTDIFGLDKIMDDEADYDHRC